MELIEKCMVFIEKLLHLQHLGIGSMIAFCVIMTVFIILFHIFVFVVLDYFFPSEPLEGLTTHTADASAAITCAICASI